MHHRTWNDLQTADMPSTAQFFNTPEGYPFGFGTTVGNGVEGWAPNAIFVDTDASQGSAVYTNTGTKTTAVWTEIADAGVAGGFVLTDTSAIGFGTDSDFLMAFDGTNLEILPGTDDTGTFNIGDGTTDCDFKWFGGAAGDVVSFDVGLKMVFLDGVDLWLKDNDVLQFGDGNDVIVQWDGTNMVASAAANAMWDSCPSKLDPNYLQAVLEFEDDMYEIDTTATVGKWIAFNVGTGTTTIEDNVRGGILLLSCQPTTDDGCEQLNLISKPFLLAAGKHLYYEARVQLIGDATESEVSFGLIAQTEDLTAVGDVLPNDGISFSKQDGATAIDFTASKGGTDTGASAGIDTLASGVYVTYGFYVNGVTNITPYIDGVAGTPITATLPDDSSIGPYFLVRNGDGTTTEVLHVDYVRVVQLR